MYSGDLKGKVYDRMVTKRTVTVQTICVFTLSESNDNVNCYVFQSTEFGYSFVKGF